MGSLYGEIKLFIIGNYLLDRDHAHAMVRAKSSIKSDNNMDIALN